MEASLNLILFYTVISIVLIPFVFCIYDDVAALDFWPVGPLNRDEIDPCRDKVGLLLQLLLWILGFGVRCSSALVICQGTQVVQKLKLLTNIINFQIHKCVVKIQDENYASNEQNLLILLPPGIPFLCSLGDFLHCDLSRPGVSDSTYTRVPPLSS